MKPKSLKSGTRVLITWDDAKPRAGWFRADSVFHPARMQTAGFVINSNNECLTVSHSANLVDGWFWESVSIPWGCIKRIKKGKA